MSGFFNWLPLKVLSRVKFLIKNFQFWATIIKMQSHDKNLLQRLLSHFEIISFHNRWPCEQPLSYLLYRLSYSKTSYVLKINLFMIRFLSYFAYFDLFQRCQIISTRSYNKPTGCQILTDLSLGYECQNNHVQTWIIYYEKFILAWKTFWEVHFEPSAILEIIIHIV